MKTYHMFEEGAEQRDEKIWIAQPGSGLDKRQCTLQVCVRPLGTQPRLGIIFPGLGKRITDDERNAWHKDVDVYFQANAWANTEMSVNWVEKTLAPAVKDTGRFVLFCDNLTAQTKEEFKTAVASKSGVVWFGVAGATDMWQPVDAGYAQLLKVLLRQEHEKWLDDDEHADRWYGNVETFTAKERRVLLTCWAGEAYRKLCNPMYDTLRMRIFTKTGCLITSDGSDDHLIKPEGLLDYTVPPPATYIQPSTDVPTTVDVEPCQMPEDVGEEAEPELADGEVPFIEDIEEDRVFMDDFNLVGKQLKVLYENGWFVGDIVYYNKILNEYKLNYDDGTSDFICPSDIDNVEVILLD